MNKKRFREEMTYFNVRIERDVWQAFKAVTRETGASAILRMFIKQYIKGEKE